MNLLNFDYAYLEPRFNMAVEEQNNEKHNYTSSDEVPLFEATEQCKQCKGKCCKRLGCYLSPSDIKDEVTLDSVTELLNTGNYSIDWYDNFNSIEYGDTDGYFIRARHVDAPIVDASYGGQCKLLTESGCALSYEERPLGGKALEPKPSGCDLHYTKLICAKEWDKYHSILEEAVELFD